MSVKKFKWWEFSVIALLLSVMVFSTLVQVRADELHIGSCSYDYTINAGGSYECSDPATKTEGRCQAMITVTGYYNDTGYGIVSRGIKYTSGAVATDQVMVPGTGTYYVDYKSEYASNDSEYSIKMAKAGCIKTAYYLKMSTSINSSTSKSATISGRWTP